jgi:hypothetical protein
MPLDAKQARVLEEWLRNHKSVVQSHQDRDLLKSVRTRTQPEPAITSLERVATRHTDRLDKLEAALAIVVEQLLVLVPRAQEELEERRDAEQSPYRGGPAIAPPGFFACRSCGVVLPDSQACASAEGRFCLQCFEP